MAHRDDVIRYANEYLQIDKIQDYSPAGLQVEGKAEVRKIVTAVSASVQLFQEAVHKNADMIIVHHGLFWDRDSRVIRGHLKQRLQILLHNDLTLLGYHLALDDHPVLGNNVLAAEALEMTIAGNLGHYGIHGSVAPVAIDDFVQRVQSAFQSQVLHFDFGPRRITRIGFCSGGGEPGLLEAVKAGLDAYVTGEAKESTMHVAKENGIHFIAAGHYATERSGIRRLGEHLAEVFSVEVEFIDIVNPV
jgi:dinuclear metal center YbgI/SA1388 family protein